MELLGIVLLFCILTMGCVVFYLLLQFNRITRQAHENDRLIKEALAKLDQKVDGLKVPQE